MKSINNILFFAILLFVIFFGYQKIINKKSIDETSNIISKNFNEISKEAKIIYYKRTKNLEELCHSDTSGTECYNIAVTYFYKKENKNNNEIKKINMKKSKEYMKKSCDYAYIEACSYLPNY